MCRQKKKTGAQVPSQYSPPPMPPVKKPNPNYIPLVSVKEACAYSTPCGWCTKWDKCCNRKIGNGHNDPAGPKGAIGICPVCGKCENITWNPHTDVSSCTCGWEG